MITVPGAVNVDIGGYRMSAASSAAAVGAAATSNAASNANKSGMCRELMQGYIDATASIREKQSYAQCVTRIHPEQTAQSGLFLSTEASMVIAVIIGAIITFAVSGVCGLSFKSGPYLMLKIFLFGVLWLLISGIVYAVIALVIILL